MSGKYVPFEPTGPTIKVAGDTTSPSGITTTSRGGSINMQYRIHNNGLVTAYYAFGVDAGTAQTNAAIPTGSGANAKDSYPIGAGALEVLTAPRGTFWSAITASSTADVFVTPGGGI